MLALSFQENMGDFVFCQIQKLTWHDSFVRLYPPVLCINILYIFIFHLFFDDHINNNNTGIY